MMLPRAAMRPIQHTALAAIIAFCWCWADAPRESHAVSARITFDALDEAFNDGNGYKQRDNLEAILAWGESYLMMGYAAM